MRYATLFIGAILCLCIACTGCHSAKKGVMKKASCLTEQSDSAIVKALGDSVASIITKADKVIVNDLFEELPEGTPHELTLSKGSVETLKFIIENPANFLTYQPVYGVFTPSVIFTFKGKKGREVKMECDFGLGKYRLVDAKGDMICRYDMSGTSLLRFTAALYPADTILKLTLESLKK